MLVTYQEKKPDLSTSEVESRKEIIDLMKECMRQLKVELEEQTNQF